MDSMPPPTSNFGSIARTITKILRFRRNVTTYSASGFNFDQEDDEIDKLKPSKGVEDYPQVLSEVEDNEKLNKESLESLLANLFTSISAIKASYAQLQVAQLPYDPETIQLADQAVISELKHLSELKHSYFKNQAGPPPPPLLAAQIQEHHNLIKTYQITTKKLESEIHHKDSEIVALQSQLIEYDRQNRFLESKLHPGRMISSLDDLRFSGLDPTHFLAALRYAVRAIRSFVKLMVGEMESAGWDLTAAANSIQPDMMDKPSHRIFAFESFVCQKMFSDFNCRDFGLSSMEERDSWAPRQFFDEFAEVKSVKLKQFLSTQKGRSSGFGVFWRAKYLTLVHPKMEASFFGDLDQRGIVSSGRGFPEPEFFGGFAEMARRVWLLHCLFFSFGREMTVSIFQVKRGCQFSEVYMESVLEEKELDGVGSRPAVGFTVVPGFKVGKTVFQCKVYLSGWMENRRRS